MNDTLPTYIESISRKAKEPCEALQERINLLELARKTNIPSPLEEDWRKTDPSAFPWDILEQTNSEKTQRSFSLQTLDGSDNKDLQTISVSGLNPNHVHDLLMIAGDDFDAKFLYYHKAMRNNVVSLKIPKGFKGSPLELIQQSAGPGLSTFTTLLVVESGAEATLYDRWESSDLAPIVIGRIAVLVEDDAKLTYIHEDSFNHQASLYRRARFQLGRDAKLNLITMTPGAAWHVARHEVCMNGSGSEACLHGLFVGSGAARADHRTLQYHAAPHASSNFLFKALLSGTAHSVYQGMIEVPQIAQKTDAYQKCRNLLLDNGARADAIPKLEIIADDVKCSHGASVGTVNANQMFYLQSRGLNYRQAMNAIASGFAEEIIHKVGNEKIEQRWREKVAETIISLPE